jgi:hypothetical protein
MQVLPTDSVTVPAEIARRRKAAQAALLAARVSLWTTDAEGFSAGHTLDRTLRMVELPQVGR